LTKVIEPDLPGYRAIATLYNAWMTGLVLSLVSRHGTTVAREFVFRHFRQQHLEKFLPGLKKLGLDGLPHAVACALYHYHSNALGGVKTEFFQESDRKAWVRYPPPRWIWRGAAICAIPREVNEAMLHGWHGHNGVSLGNQRLGFVCTGQTVNGDPGLEGYYCEYDHPLAENERVRFTRGERMPHVDANDLPQLDAASWPPERLHKTYRSYAMEYVRTFMPVLAEQLGSMMAMAEIARAARLIGLHYFEETYAQVGAGSFIDYLARMLAAQGEDVRLEADGATLHQRGWRLMRGVSFGHAAARDAALQAWAELWRGALAAYDRRMTLALEPSGDDVVWKPSAPGVAAACR
jgi:hypothetical protein